MHRCNTGASLCLFPALCHDQGASNQRDGREFEPSSCRLSRTWKGFTVNCGRSLPDFLPPYCCHGLGCSREISTCTTWHTRKSKILRNHVRFETVKFRFNGHGVKVLAAHREKKPTLNSLRIDRRVYLLLSIFKVFFCFFLSFWIYFLLFFDWIKSGRHALMLLL